MRSFELICHGFVTRSSSTTDQSRIVGRGRSHAARSPGAWARLMTGTSPACFAFIASQFILSPIVRLTHYNTGAAHIEPNGSPPAVPRVIPSWDAVRPRRNPHEG